MPRWEPETGGLTQRPQTGCSEQGHLLATELERSPLLWDPQGKDTRVLGWEEQSSLLGRRSSDPKSDVQPGPPCRGQGPGGAGEARGAAALAVAAQMNSNL